MEKPILLVGGGKGGVGKSLLSVPLVDYVGATDLSFGDRVELERWRDECGDMFSQVLRD